ncbi:MAG: alpha/beta hydrolase [Bacteroidota bacterium]
MKVYFFSGLGADARLFQRLEAPEGFEFVALDYIPPGNSRSIGDYARLLSDHYDFEEPFILGGVSIGGMIVQELAQIIEAKAVILISTAMSRSEMPLLFTIARKLPVGFLMNKSFLSAFAKTLDPFTVKSVEGRELFLEMLEDTPADFLKFGSNAILNWRPPLTTVKTIRIHGTRDRVFPARKISNAHMIKGGNHFMAFEKAKEISEVLRRELT